MKYRYEEKLKMDRKEEIKARLAKQLPTRVFSYIHNQGRIGVLLEIQSDTDFGLRTELVENFAHEVCLQIASMNPVAVSVEDCKMRAAVRESIDDGVTVDKPEIRAKIVAGKLAKWDKEHILLEQPWVKDGTRSIVHLLGELQTALGEATEIIQFARFGQ